MNNTDRLLVKPMSESLKAARSAFQNESFVKILIENQIQELPRVRKKFPTLKREDAIMIALLNSASKLQDSRYSEKYSLAKVKKMKKSPQLNWLKLHRSFIFQLRANGASLRETQQAILFRFRHKISHSKIAEFLKMEANNA